MRLLVLPALSLAVTGAFAHGDHGSGSKQPAIPDDANWMTKHMAGKFSILNSRLPQRFLLAFT